MTNLLFDIEEKPGLCELAGYNLPLLGIKAEVIQGDSINFLKNYKGKADWLFIDPDRRDSSDRKLVSFADCKPDLID